MDQQQLSVLKEELTIKKEMISDIKENDRQYQHTMARFAAIMENLSQTVSTMVGMIGSGMVASQPSSTIPNEPIAECAKHHGSLVTQQNFSTWRLYFSNEGRC